MSYFVYSVVYALADWLLVPQLGKRGLTFLLSLRFLFGGVSFSSWCLG